MEREVRLEAPETIWHDVDMTLICGSLIEVFEEEGEDAPPAFVFHDSGRHVVDADGVAREIWVPLVRS